MLAAASSVEIWTLVLGFVTVAAIVTSHFMRDLPRSPAFVEAVIEDDASGFTVVSFVNRGGKQATDFVMESEPERLRIDPLGFTSDVIMPGSMVQFRFTYGFGTVPEFRWTYRSGKWGRRKEGEWSFRL